MSEPDELNLLPAYDKDPALRALYGSTYVACGVVLAFSVAAAVSFSWWYLLAVPLCVIGAFANHRSRNAMTRPGFLGWKIIMAIGLIGGIGLLAAVTSQLPATPVRSAPAVSRPVDAGRFLASPCELLSGDQLSSLGIRPRGEPSAGSRQPGTICTWIDDPTNNVLNAQWLVTYRNGLSDLYRERDRQAYFEETTVGGFPAVFTGVKDQRSIGECDLEVGTSEHDVLRVGFAVPLQPESNPCDLAKKAATAMLDTLGRGW